MADSNQSRRADPSDFSESDPFAELTRIMGHDPRVESGPEPTGQDASAARDEFGFDLEKELMGELDFSEFDEPNSLDGGRQLADADWRSEQVSVRDDQQPFSKEPAFDVDHSVEDLAASIMDTFDADEADTEPTLAGVEEAPAAISPVEFDDVPVDQMLERELAGWDDPETLPASAATWNADDSEPEESSAEDVASPADPRSFGEPDLGSRPFQDDLGQDPRIADRVVDNSPEAAGYADVDDAGAEQAATGGGVSEASLEDELNALLSAGDAAINAERTMANAAAEYSSAGDVAATHDSEPHAEAGDEDVWRPVVNTFGRANFSAIRSPHDPAGEVEATAARHVVEEDQELVDFSDLPEWDEPEALDLPKSPEEPEFPRAGGPESVSVDADGVDVFTSIFADALAMEDTEEPAGSTTAELDEVLSHFSVTAPRDDEQAHEPANGIAASSIVQPVAPDVETVDVEEAAYAVSDDLDLPEVDYGTPAPPVAPFDDFSGDFAHAFDDTSHLEANPSTTQVGASTWAGTAAYAEPAAQQPSDFHPVDAAGAYALGEGEWQADDLVQQDDLGLGDDFSFDDEFDQALANSVMTDEVAHERPRSRRGLVVAAAVAAVAIFGGIGILGMSLFGGGSDTPAVVRADSDPMKVRPENPGGTVVPNQDSEAYNRVAGGADTSAPEQESLITTAEEPMDITAETASPALPSSISDGEEDIALADTDPAETSAAPAQPKSEERIEPAAEEPEGVGASGDLLAVTPRKVRTMIVRPDGTMVPREMPQTDEETVIAAAPLAAPALAPATAQTLEQPDAAASEQDANPSVDTPDTVAVVPSQRSESTPAQTVPEATRPAPQPAEQTPPATAVSAPAAAAPVAAASEWSMQIASQPTAESAQATYQDLARRYGNVLEGRGVNIVRADIAGKGTYYRVRIPSASRDEAINLCTRYKSAGGSCFVSR